jgi:hypothetical protein
MDFRPGACGAGWVLRLALLTLLTLPTMIAFAANSVLNRPGVAGEPISAAEAAGVRLLSGAGMFLAPAGLRAAVQGGAFWAGRRVRNGPGAARPVAGCAVRCDLIRTGVCPVVLTPAPARCDAGGWWRG